MRAVLLSLALLAATPAMAAPCAARLHFVQEVIDKDLKTGFVGKVVHDEMAADLAKASASCDAGQDAKAQSEIDATQRKHGYPVR